MYLGHKVSAAALFLSVAGLETSSAERRIAVGSDREAMLHVRQDRGSCADLALPRPENRPPLPGTGGVMIQPVDPDYAVCSEFREIERRGTAEAYRLFIARHPDHPLAGTALRRLKALHPE